MASHLEQDFLSILLANISIQVCFQSISSAGEKKLSVCKSELNHDRTNKLYKTDVQTHQPNCNASQNYRPDLNCWRETLFLNGIFREYSEFFKL